MSDSRPPTVLLRRIAIGLPCIVWKHHPFKWTLELAHYARILPPSLANGLILHGLSNWQRPGSMAPDVPLEGRNLKARN